MFLADYIYVKQSPLARIHYYVFLQDPVAFFRKVKEDTGVDFLAPNGRLSRGSTGMGGGGGGGMRGGPPERMPSSGTYDTFGLSPVFLHQLGIEGPLCNRVFVANVRDPESWIR
jgi:hypothetical protein